MRGLLVALSLFVLPACALPAESREASDAAPPYGDDASDLSPDGGSDASPVTPPIATRDGFPLTDGGLSPDLEETCYDGEPNEPGSESDCASATCHPSRACCIGNVECCGPAPGFTPLDTDFETCDVGEQSAILTCLDPETARLFGDSTGRIVEGGLAPGGSIERASGLVLREGLDPLTHRVTISTRFARPAECGPGCVDSAAVGLLTRLSDDSPNTERPAIALILGGNGGDVRLAVRGEERGRWTLPPLDAEQPTWRLQVAPTGVVELFRDDEPAPVYQGAAPHLPELDLVIYGRNRNPAGPISVSRVASLSFEIALCDIPDAWSSRTPLTLFTGPATTYLPDTPAKPSLSKTDTGAVYIAFVEGLDSERRIRFGRQNESAPSSFTLYGSTEESSLMPEGIDESGGITDPALLWDTDSSRMYMYYTRFGSRETSSIHRAVWSEETSSFIRAGAPLVIPSPPGTSTSSPTLVRDPSGSWLMIYREIQEGAELWKSAVSVDGEHWDAIDNSTLDARLQQSRSTIEEVAEPSLVVHGGAYLLHYSRRRGARWSVGALASHTFLHWRRLDGAAPVLSRSNVGFDSLSVRSPALVTNASGLEMVYVATSGEQNQLGFTMREASPVGMFAPRAD